MPVSLLLDVSLSIIDAWPAKYSSSFLSEET